MNNDIALRNFSKRRAHMFLQFLGETGKVKESALLAGFKDPEAVYYRRRTDPDFAREWELAVERAGDIFEQEAIRRAVEGVTKDVYYKGEIVGKEQVYSDGLLAKLLDGAKPDKYQKKKTEVTGGVNVNVGLAVIPMTAPNLEDWERDAIALHDQGKLIDGKAVEVKPEPKAIVAPKVVRA